MKKFLLSLILMLSLGVPAFCADQWDKDAPAGSASPSSIDTLIGTNNEAIDRLVSNYREGLKLTYASASTITIASGEVVCSKSDGSIRKFRKNTSSTTLTWSDLDTGSEVVSTTYYVYAVADTDAETFTGKISVNATFPTGVTYAKRLGSFYNNADGDIEQITNDNATELNSYDSGWFAVAIDTSYVKTHSLGTTNSLISVYISDESDGSGKLAMCAGELTVDGASNFDMCGVRALTTSTVTLRTGQTRLAATEDYNGTQWSPSSGYARIVMLALD